jgi:poly(hydroxyalkanoate) depolymerase family esterase
LKATLCLGVALVTVGVCARAQVATTPAPMTRARFTNAQGSRELAVFTPSSLPSKPEERAMVVMLHGCAQTADDLARGTQMNAAAERERFIVVYPEQPASANPQKCWNWFLPDNVMRDKGETALLAGLIDSVARAHGVRRVSLVGMSAGAAMAANLAVAYPERYAALALHSGIPAFAAKDVMGAITAMRQGATDGDALGAAALAAMGSRARPIPVIALHGSDDKIVSPNNLEATVRQWTVVNSGGASVEKVVLDGVGHAWSGGSSEGTFTAPTGPDATGMIVAFLKRVKAI